MAGVAIVLPGLEVEIVAVEMDEFEVDDDAVANVVDVDDGDANDVTIDCDAFEAGGCDEVALDTVDANDLGAGGDEAFVDTTVDIEDGCVVDREKFVCGSEIITDDFDFDSFSSDSFCSFSLFSFFSTAVSGFGLAFSCGAADWEFCIEACGDCDSVLD